MAMTRSAAETFAAQALAWLAEDPARFGGFLAWSGEGPAALRERIADPGFLLAVIEFLLADEALLIEACSALDYAPTIPMQARIAMPGGGDIHWT